MGSGDIILNAKPGTPEAVVRGRFSASGQQHDSRRRRLDRRGDVATPAPSSCTSIMLLAKSGEPRGFGGRAPDSNTRPQAEHTGGIGGHHTQFGAEISEMSPEFRIE